VPVPCLSLCKGGCIGMTYREYRHLEALRRARRWKRIKGTIETVLSASIGFAMAFVVLWLMAAAVAEG